MRIFPTISNSSAHPDLHSAPELKPEPVAVTTDSDYPRPVADADIHHHSPAHDEEPHPKKDRKHLDHDAERHLRELAQKKAQSAQPSKDLMTGNRVFGAAGRIGQPAGRALGV